MIVVVGRHTVAAEFMKLFSRVRENMGTMSSRCGIINARRGRVVDGQQPLRIAAHLCSAGVTLKCLPHEKSARGKIITYLI